MHMPEKVDRSVQININKYLGSMTFNRAPEVRITPLGENAVLYGALAAVFDRVGFPGE